MLEGAMGGRTRKRLLTKHLISRDLNEALKFQIIDDEKAIKQIGLQILSAGVDNRKRLEIKLHFQPELIFCLKEQEAKVPQRKAIKENFINRWNIFNNFFLQWKSSGTEILALHNLIVTFNNKISVNVLNAFGNYLLTIVWSIFWLIPDGLIQT